ncbi:MULTISPECIES: toll/interleukin-1 receptor domain-containing protein [Flavobacterium]|uniref:toll/interleukin-1 receptor domain-containing protein n=1 Tax=Flavobacterium TaxID=237 RepID=UPI0028096F76|nr:toll/interleukin-1 receptor domain-containing protein [Flavobacterium lindanitolerans]MDQ7961056.1 toll/interleukin-1 receptor domain-containing protein [Flavobacterium lindanitolerans]
MNIFISWSGKDSKEIASALKNWIPTVLQSAKPYFTPSDIEKGSKWESEITKKLNECKVGIICLTAENTEKPWILFEAGALSNKLEKSRVCPILFGLTNSDLKGPLATFQTTEFKKEDFKKLMKTINLLLEDNKISDVIFDEVFEAFFPKLENTIVEILKSKNNDEKIQSIPKRSDRDILEEILELTRKQYVKPKISEEKPSIEDLLLLKNSSIGSLSSRDTLKFKVGDRVRHSRFGDGEVLSIIERGIKDSTIEIKFDIGGIKKLLIRFASLEKL